MLVEDTVLWSLAAAMAYVTALLLKKSVSIKNYVNLAIIMFLLIMMASMLAGAVIYFFVPSFEGIVIAVALNMVSMNFGLIPLLYYWVAGKAESKETSTNTAIVQKDSRIAALVIFLVLSNETLMGWAFQMASGVNINLFFQSPLTFISSVISSYWFIFTMSLEMTLTAYYFRKELPGGMLLLIAFQTLIMFLSPTAVQSSIWKLLSTALGSVLMSIYSIWMFDSLIQKKLTYSLARYVLTLTVIYAVMMLGLYLWGEGISSFVFSSSIIAEMVLYLSVIIRRNNLMQDKEYNHDLTLRYLPVASVAQMFMGASGVSILLGIAGYISNLPFISPVYFYSFSAVFAVFVIWLLYIFVLHSLKAELMNINRSNTIKAITSIFTSEPYIFFIGGVALFPLSVLTPLDSLADNNPAFHMLQHFMIGVSGFVAALSLVAIALNKSPFLSRLYFYFAKYSRRGILSLELSIALLTFWFIPVFFNIAAENETIHIIEHISIFVAAFLAGLSIKLITRQIITLLITSFFWMSVMMLPFVLIFGPYAYSSASSYSNIMALGMFSWIAMLLYPVISRFHHGSRSIHAAEVEHVYQEVMGKQ
ncbi:MAG: DUF1404 family protein [Nitrososphaerota archaeon]